MHDDQHTNGGTTSPEAQASGDVAEPQAGDGSGDGAAVQDELEAALRERDDYLDQLRRLSAEFQNYKKRMAREQQSLVERSTERLVKELLPIFDDLERALVAFEAHDDAQVAKGVELVHRSFGAVLEREGIVPIEPTGEPFDPHRHEALLSQPSDEAEGTVIQVVQRGFTLGDRVVRPARVVVAAPKD